jgi:hypothetical protein
LDAAAERDVQIRQRLRVDSSVRSAAVAALKAFDGVDERALVDGRIGRDVGAGRKIADEAEQPREPRDAGIGVAGSYGFLCGRA